MEDGMLHCLGINILKVQNSYQRGGRKSYDHNKIHYKNKKIQQYSVPILLCYGFVLISIILLLMCFFHFESSLISPPSIPSKQFHTDSFQQNNNNKHNEFVTTKETERRTVLLVDDENIFFNDGIQNMKDNSISKETMLEYKFSQVVVVKSDINEYSFVHPTDHTLWGLKDVVDHGFCCNLIPQHDDDDDNQLASVKEKKICSNSSGGNIIHFYIKDNHHLLIHLNLFGYPVGQRIGLSCIFQWVTKKMI